MRIIAGSAKGRKLKSISGQSTRPLTDRVKESLFSILRPNIEGARVLDLYAGSGAFSLEAISRGAESSLCVEVARTAFAVLCANIAHCDFGEMVTPVLADAIAYAKGLTSDGTRFDIVFADPPFNAPESRKSRFHILLRYLNQVCEDDGLLVIRVQAKVQSPEVDGMKMYRRHKLGVSHLLFYRKAAEDE